MSSYRFHFLQRKIRRQGNSLGLTIPHVICRVLDIKLGDIIEFNLDKESGKVFLFKVADAKEPKEEQKIGGDLL